MSTPTMSTEVIAPWYRQPWAWFVITPLIVVVIACGFTVSVAFNNRDDVVLDNYYNEGRAINNRFLEDQQAQAIGATGELIFDRKAGQVLLDLHAKAALPDTITLQMSHPVKAAYDRQITLKQIAPGRYQGDADELLQYHWYVRLTPVIVGTGSTWQLKGEIDFATGDRVTLEPPLNAP